MLRTRKQDASYEQRADKISPIAKNICTHASEQALIFLNLRGWAESREQKKQQESSWFPRQKDQYGLSQLTKPKQRCYFTVCELVRFLNTKKEQATPLPGHVVRHVVKVQETVIVRNWKVEGSLFPSRKFRTPGRISPRQLFPLNMNTHRICTPAIWVTQLSQFSPILNQNRLTPEKKHQPLMNNPA